MADGKSSESGAVDWIHLLPDEVLEIIVYLLEGDELEQLAKCSERLNILCNGSQPWKRLCVQRWFKAVTNGFEFIAVDDWKAFYRLCEEHEKKILQSLKGMSSKCYTQKEVSQHACAEILSIMRSRILPHTFVLQILKQFMHDERLDLSLTEKYYARRVLKICTKHKLRRDLETILDSDDPSSLVMGAQIIESWCALTVEEADTLDYKSDVIDTTITQLYQNTCVRLQKQRFALSHSTSSEMSDFDLSLVSDKKKVVTLSCVMFKDEGFCGNTLDYYHPNNSYISKVLQEKKGNPITLSVIYHAVALRLGVECLPVSFPSHFLLKYLEHPQLQGSQRFTYIDVFNGGRFLDAGECGTKLGTIPRALITEKAYDAVSFRQVWHRMLRNLLDVANQYTDHNRPAGMDFLLYVFELTDIVESENSVKIHIARLYLLQNVNIEEIGILLSPICGFDETDLFGMVNFLKASAKEQIQENIKLSQVTPKRRSEYPEVTYHVGQIMTHKRYDYKCVIYGWDRQCRANTDWIYQMGVHLLHKKQWQPFYNVLVHDGTCRYAAQESLKPSGTNSHEIVHPDVGKYFQEYHTTYYSLNREVQEHFPEDECCSATGAQKTQR